MESPAQLLGFPISPAGMVSVMSALPAYQLPLEEVQSTEVIYLVVPPAAPVICTPPRPYSFAERCSIILFNFQSRSKSKSDKAHALAFALSFTLLAGFWAYNVKSAFGINIFPHQHIENFAPLPGWQR
jgi:hypothetical protein